MPIIVYVHIHLGRAYFKARGVKNIPVKSGIVYPDVDYFLYGPG